MCYKIYVSSWIEASVERSSWRISFVIRSMEPEGGNSTFDRLRAKWNTSFESGHVVCARKRVKQRGKNVPSLGRKTKFFHIFLSSVYLSIPKITENRRDVVLFLSISGPFWSCPALSVVESEAKKLTFVLYIDGSRELAKGPRDRRNS